MISQYDEYPVHQSPHPFAHIPVTDYAWNEGYYFGVYSAEDGVFLFSGMRVNPNTDMIGGYVGVSVRGRQYTARFSRPWRAEMDTRIGPLSYEFLVPLERIRLALGPNDSELELDVEWVGVGSVHEEPHHLAESRGRRVADLTRYYQSGTAQGWISLGDQRFEVVPRRWWASRDHSWGIYLQRPPLVPDARWLPPAEAGPGPRRGLRWASWWGSERSSGLFSVHESQDGDQVPLNDVFGTPLEGVVEVDGRRLHVVSARHEMDFHSGTRVLRSATWHLVDADGGEWTQVYETRPGGWNPATIGYRPGSWKDGGTMFTYHGSDGVVQEWDDYDFTALTYDHTMHDGTVLEATHSFEYLTRVTTTAPDGTVTTGAGQVELFITRYTPYGFDEAPTGGSTGQGT